MPQQNTEHRKLAAIMFTDMVGYSALSQRNEKLALELLEEHRVLLRAVFPRFNGKEIKTIGDAFLVEFHSALEAAQCAIEMQRALAKRNHDVPNDRRVEIKIGIHIGDVVHRGGDVYGDGVNIASRIEPLAGAGGICVSMDVERQIRTSLEVRFEKLAPTELKNISVAMDLFRIVLPWEKEKKSEVGSQKSETSASGRSSLTARFVGIGALLLLLIGAGWWFLHQSRQTPKPGANLPGATSSPTAAAPIATEQKSIAVLPFVSMSADKADEYLSDGMTEELLNVLAQVPGLKVPGRSSSFAFKDKNGEDIFRKVGEQLHVATVLEGSVRKAGDKLRITVQLINVADGFHLWSQTYDRDMKDILSVQTEVAQQVVQVLELKLGVEAAQALAKTPTENPEAHRLYLLGRYYWFKGTEESSKKAIEYFNQALHQDSNYARAYCGLADTLGDWKLAPKEFIPKMRAYAETALKLDPLLAEAHNSMAGLFFSPDWDFAGAEKEFQQALKLNPNLALAHDGYAWYLACLGRLPEALAEQKKAVELEPLSALMTVDLGWIYYIARDFNKSIEVSRQAMELDASYPWSYQLMGWSLLMQGKPGEAIPQFEKQRSLADFPWTRSYLGCAYAAAGDRAKAEVVLKDLEDLATRQFVSPMSQAVIWSFLNEKGRALELLERAVAERDPSCIALKVDPAWGSLRTEPRFQALLKKVGLDQ